MLADEQLSPEQINILRQMTPEQRLAAAESLYWTARNLKKAWLRSLHPDWTDDQIIQEVNSIFRDART